jgi:hypothetical protein
MTVINGIEIDDVTYIPNEIKSAILNNDKIEDKLHVITVVSNPCQFARRYILAREFLLRMQDEKDVILYVVELAYKNQKFHVTQENNPRHLQLRCDVPIWHKENMINMGVRKLLPDTWKAFAWIDADVEFDNPEWASDALRVLNGSRDIVQLFSHAVDMDFEENAMSIFSSFGFQYTKKRPYSFKGVLSLWHPGFAWACTKKAYNKMGGLYEVSILGAGDHNMTLSLINAGKSSVNEAVTDDYQQSVLSFQQRVKNLRLGYIPGVVRHYFHGTKKNRRYGERWQILVRHQFSPSIHLTTDKHGILIPTKECPQAMLDDIYNYFSERNEDECCPKK